MISAEHFQQKDYRILKDYIDRGIPVLVNVRYTGAVRGLRPGPRGHWMVLRGIDDKHVWVNHPGRSPEMRTKGENICYPIKKQPGNPSYFDGCWTERFYHSHSQRMDTKLPVCTGRQAPSIGGGDSYSSSGCARCNLTAGYQSVEATHS